LLWDKDKTGIDPDYPLATKHYFSGGAGLTGTAYDYAIFLQMMLNKGKYNGVQILASRTVELMTSGQLDFAFNGMDNFGLGFEITSEKSAARNPRNSGSFSWGGFFGTTYWADPKAKLICLIMTQQVPNSHGDLATKFEQLVYQSLK
jgi:CubicO group peptidase (beta-lactamase class C family)